MKAREIAAKAADLVGGDRDRVHGSKRKNFEDIATLWSAYLARRGVSVPETEIIQPEWVGDMMELLKIARRMSGEVNVDDYIDAAGYAACAGELALAKVPSEVNTQPYIEADKQNGWDTVSTKMALRKDIWLDRQYPSNCV